MLTDKVERELDMLRRHMTVLIAVIENEPIGILKLSEVTGFPNHKVRYSLRILEHENLIAPSPYGAITTQNTMEFMEQFDDNVGKIIDIARDLKEMTR